jgi:hypothetical protein
MAKVTVYLPDRLAEAVRAVGMNLSNVTRVAAERELAQMRVSSWLSRVALQRAMDVPHGTAFETPCAAHSDHGDGRPAMTTLGRPA